MKLKNRKGFTLVELIIAMSILSVVMFLGYKSINKNITFSKEQKDKSEISQVLTLMRTYLTKDLEKSIKITYNNIGGTSDYEYIVNINNNHSITYKIQLKKDTSSVNASIIREEIKNGKKESTIELANNINLEDKNNLPLEIIKDNQLYTIKLNAPSKKENYVFQTASKKVSNKIVSNFDYLSISDYTLKGNVFNKVGGFTIQSGEEGSGDLLFDRPDYAPAGDTRNYQKIPIDIRAIFAKNYITEELAAQHILYTPYYKEGLSPNNGFTDTNEDKMWYKLNYGNPRKIVQQYDINISANNSQCSLNVDGIRYINGDIVSSDKIKSLSENISGDISKINTVEIMFDDETKVINLEINGLKQQPKDSNKLVQHNPDGYTYYLIEGIPVKENLEIKFSIQTVSSKSINPDQRLGISFGYK